MAACCAGVLGVSLLGQPLGAQDSVAARGSLYRRVVLRVTVPNDSTPQRYDIARALPAVEARMRGDESVNAFIQRRYAAALGSVQDSLRAAIALMNGTADTAPRRRNTTLSVPNLPRRDSGIPEKDVTWPVTRYRLREDARLPAQLRAEDNPDRGRSAAPTGHLIEIEGTEAQIDSLFRAYRDSGVTTPAQVPYATIGIDWRSRSAAAMAAADPVLRQNERDLVRKLVAEPKRPTYVIILDSGWPSRGARDSSVSALYDLLDQIRRDPLIGRPALPRPNLGAFTAPSSDHCVTIAEALEEFVALDTGKAVRVIYVPLSKDQNAKQVLKDLLETQYLIQIVRSERRIPSDADVDRVKRLAEEALNGVPGVVNAGEVFLTSTAIVSAVYYVLDELARLHAGFHFVNESWTVVGKTMMVPFPSPTRVLGVSAVGNIRERDVLTNEVDFSGRSGQHRDHLAVLNMARDGTLQCSSSTVGNTGLEDIMAIAFDGRVGTECGSSFAAPRVAWLLAAMESARSGDAPPSAWANGLHRRLVAARGNRTTIAGLWLDLLRLNKS